MKIIKLTTVLIALALATSCGSFRAPDYKMGDRSRLENANSAGGHSGDHSGNTAHGSSIQNLTETGRPQKLTEMMAERGEQDAANPTLRFVEPTNGATINSSTVRVKLDLGGDLKGYATGKDPQTGMGNHIHVILDNQPYEAYYNLNQEFELRNVSDGEHTLRVFPSRPWHESYKNEGAFQMIRFNVQNGGANANQPTTTNSGQTMSNANTSAATEGKDMKSSTASNVDPARPLLTYSRPKGEYKGADAEAIMIDFWLANAKLAGDGGEYRVRYSVDGGEAKYIDRWQPIWLSGWTPGAHTVKLELVNKEGNIIGNGDYNSTTREITVIK